MTEPSELGPFSPPPTPTGRVASRIQPVQAATLAIVAATAIALLVYFLVR